MGAYSDLDPRISPSSPPDRKIQWRVEGTAPCRKFVFSFYHISVFFNTACGAANPNTFQIVIHESTGIIEVFFEQKACFSTTTGNNGNAILGIQNWARDKAVAPPGKNLAQWSENNTGYRFIPSGGASRFVSSELWPYNMSVPLVVADTATTTTGLLDINFKNFCPSPGSNKYIVRNVFSSCSNPATVMISLDTITVNSGLSLNATVSSTNSTCLPSGSITVNVPVGVGTSPYTYSLDGAAAQSSNSATHTFTNVTQGPHSVTIIDAAGVCATGNTIVGFTNDLSLTPQPDQTICEGNFKQLQLTSNATQFTWTPATGLSSTSISNPVANPVVTTQYIVKATLGQCNLNDTMIVNVNPAPIADAGPDGSICFGQTYQLQGSGGITFSWTPSIYLNDPAVSNPVVTPDKTTVYSLSTTGANGCSSVNADNVTVTLTPPIQVIVTPTDTIGYTGDQFQLLATSVANNYTWSPSIGLSNANIPDPIITLGAIGDDVTYKVVVSTPAGCKGEGFVRIQVYKGPDVYVPTGFTPNTDGKNDKFIPIPVAIKQMNYFRIFNRWGQMIFSTTRLADGWDGKFAGIEQPAGVYVWMLQAVTKDNQIIRKKGTVALIR
jgi:gliding motility-associated-like protein